MRRAEVENGKNHGQLQKSRTEVTTRILFFVSFNLASFPPPKDTDQTETNPPNDGGSKAQTSRAEGSGRAGPD